MTTYLFACSFLMKDGAHTLVQNVTVSAMDAGAAWLQLPQALGSITSLATPLSSLVSVKILAVR